MLHLYCRLPALALCAGVLVGAEDKAGKDKDASKPSAVRIVKVDAKNGTITVRMKDHQGKEVKKTFHLTQDVRMVDETGGVVTIDIFEDDDDALIVEREGRLVELRRPARAHRARPSDLINVLIEVSECDEGCTEEVQRAYDILRRLDKNKDGKIDADELKAARQQLAEERVDNLMKSLDKDKDGKISREEARGMIKRHFDKLDRNKDGFIDREELLKAASERQDLQRSPTERK
jgi:Ca2+-binding EF-hand superfamily protein